MKNLGKNPEKRYCSDVMLKLHYMESRIVHLLIFKVKLDNDVGMAWHSHRIDPKAPFRNSYPDKSWTNLDN